MKLRVSEAIKLLLGRMGKSMAQMGRELNMGTPANMVNMINRGSIKGNVMALIGEKCGYTLMYVPNEETGKIENGIEIKGEIEE